MRLGRSWLLGLVPLLATLTACGGDDVIVVNDSTGGAGGAPGAGGTGGEAGTSAEIPETVPEFDADDFSDPASIDHPYFPLVVGDTRVYFGETEDGFETTVVEVLDETREVFGIDARVVRDRVFSNGGEFDGYMIEDTHDWFAQDDAGNVWYMGEEVDNYDYKADDLAYIDHEGAWEAGEDVADIGETALPGYQMLAMPEVGDRYHTEYYPGEAEDMAEVTDLDVSITLSDGFEASTLETREENPLEGSAAENKYYAEGIGVILEKEEDGEVELVGVFRQGEAQVPDFEGASFSAPTIIDNPYLPFEPGSVKNYEGETEDGVETTLIEVLGETREVAGIECVVVRDRVYLDDVLVEDTHDWYAQDDAGNVWYMGEDVVNYEYDDNGELDETTSDGSWEAGEDVADAGVIAAPGIVMPAAPEARTSYYQEWSPSQAEDMGCVVALDVSVELPDGTEYEDCLQTLDWAPLEPFALEYKFYAPTVGLVREQTLDGTEDAVLLPD